MNNVKEEAGCELYLYEEIQCCLHPCPAHDCPEPACAMEFPGGVRSYLKYKELQLVLRAGLTLDQAATEWGVPKWFVQQLFNKGMKFFTRVNCTAR